MAYICPQCGVGVPDIHDAIRTQAVGFNYNPTLRSAYNYEQKDLEVVMMLCPSCENKSYWVNGISETHSSVRSQIFPKSKAKKFPDYIPMQLIEDYEEAYDILELSPKASATLSRRCLQGIIRDFHKVKPGTLNNEIIQLKDIVPKSQYDVLHSLRKLGNIGAHLENDVNLIVEIKPDEAEKLIKLIEYLFEKWYVEQKETDDLFTIINETSVKKNDERKGNSNT